MIFCSLCKRLPKGSFANLLAIGLVSGPSFVLFFQFILYDFTLKWPLLGFRLQSISDGIPTEIRFRTNSCFDGGLSISESLDSNWFCDLWPEKVKPINWIVPRWKNYYFSPLSSQQFSNSSYPMNPNYVSPLIDDFPVTKPS